MTAPTDQQMDDEAFEKWSRPRFYPGPSYFEGAKAGWHSALAHVRRTEVEPLKKRVEELEYQLARCQSIPNEILKGKDCKDVCAEDSGSQDKPSSPCDGCHHTHECSLKRGITCPHFELPVELKINNPELDKMLREKRKHEEATKNVRVGEYSESKPVSPVEKPESVQLCQWVSVKERLPKKDGLYPVLSEYGSRMELLYFFEGSGIAGWGDKFKITHWLEGVPPTPSTAPTGGKP